MGFFKVLIIGIIVIVAVAYFFPNTYVNLKYMISSSLSNDSTDKLDFKETEYGKDYGKIFGVMGCDTDEQCFKYFRINGVICSSSETCYVPVVN